jgi:hypothetical protein
MIIANSPVARCVRLDRFPDRLIALAEFATEDLNPMAEQVFRMIKAGFLQACSIGFRPLRWSYNEARGGLDFHEVEMVEFSIVPIPAHPQALIAAGVDVTTMRRWAEHMLRTIDGTTTRDAIDANDALVPSAVTDARRLLENYLSSIGDEASAPRFNPLRDAVASIDQFLESLSAGRSYARRQRDDEVILQLADDPSDLIALDDDVLRDLPQIIATNLRNTIAPVIGREVKRAINDARGRLNDDDFLVGEE